MKILIVEDDSFKYDNILSVLNEVLEENYQKIYCDCIHETVVYLQDNTPDKIILDMSLPSHSQKIGGGNPLPMPDGGIEIILELESIGKNNIPIIIITQYPDIEIENDYYSIKDAGEVISKLYNIENITVTLYDENNASWKLETNKFLRKI